MQSSEEDRSVTLLCFTPDSYVVNHVFKSRCLCSRMFAQLGSKQACICTVTAATSVTLCCARKHAIDADACTCHLQKYFLALLILAQKLNTGQQGIAPKDGTDYVHSSTHHSRLSSVQMTLKSSSSHDDECAIPSTLKIALSRCEGPE